MKRILAGLALGAMVAIASMPTIAAAGPPNVGPTDTFIVAPLKTHMVLTANDAQFIVPTAAFAVEINRTAAIGRGLAAATADTVALRSTFSPTSAQTTKTASVYRINDDNLANTARPPNLMENIRATTSGNDPANDATIRDDEAGIANNLKAINETTARAAPETATKLLL